MWIIDFVIGTLKNETPLGQIKVNQMYNKIVEYYWDIRYRLFSRFRKQRECGYLQEYEKYKDLIERDEKNDTPLSQIKG